MSQEEKTNIENTHMNLIDKYTDDLLSGKIGNKQEPKIQTMTFRNIISNEVLDTLLKQLKVNDPKTLIGNNIKVSSIEDMTK
jgi:hypothetical protein